MGIKFGITQLVIDLNRFGFEKNVVVCQYNEKPVDSSQPFDGKAVSYRSGLVYWYGGP